MLELRELVCCYGKVTAVKGVSLTVGRGQLVALIGANGAGKTTIAEGDLRPAAAGERHASCSTATTSRMRRRARSCRSGIAHCPEGRHVFPHMTVAENLEMGCYLRTRSGRRSRRTWRAFSISFPRLAERRQQAAGTLSGGEQQMLAIGRALMSRPKLIMFDEPSLGLAPNIVERTFDIITGFATPARPCSWSSRTPRRRWICAITPICSNRARWRFRARAAN